jgi:signal peptidase I
MSRKSNALLDGVIEIVGILAVVLVFVTFVAQTLYVPAGSMEPTL